MGTNSFNLGLLTYNTHLFGDLAIWKALNFFSALLYVDDDRKAQLRTFLQASPGNYPLVALQEVWSAAYAGDFKKDLNPQYPNFFAKNDESNKDLDFNESGLCQFGATGITFSNYQKFDYISHCEASGPGGGWSYQDNPPIPHVTEKGYLQVTCTLSPSYSPVIPAAGVQVGLFATHLPTNAGTYYASLQNCFNALAAAVNAFAAANKSAAVIVAGDFNIVYDPNSTEYQTYIEGFLKNTSLTAVFNDSSDNTIVPATNLLWQHFNPNESGNSPSRVDYVFYQNSADGTVQLSVSNAGVLVTDSLRVSQDGNVDVSDHYPLAVTFTVTIPSAV